MNMLETAEVVARLFGSPSTDGPETISILHTMLDAGEGISDLVLSPGRPPQVEQHGQLMPVEIANVTPLLPAQTARIARDLVEGNTHALRVLQEHGACDLSYSLQDRARLRVNVF